MEPNNNFTIMDGAMGTCLLKMGLKPGQKGEFFNIEAPDKVIKVHKDYIEAGSQIIYTNTFGISRRKLQGFAYNMEELLIAGVKNAKIARGNRPVKIALALSSVGEMLEPLGSLSFEEAYELFKEQVVLGQKEGAGLVVLETITDLYELKAGILAVKENTNLPLITTMSFEKNGRSFNGCLPESFALTATGLGVDALGINCSLGPKEIYPLMERIAKVTNLPLVVKANAGLPNLQGDYGLDAKDFYREVGKVTKLGVQYIGGCCGTDPAYIAALAKGLKDKKCPVRKRVFPSAICSATNYLPLEGFIGVGERINPSGREDLRESLADGDTGAVVKEAVMQSEGPCQVLDVNLGGLGVKEEELMPKAIRDIQALVDLPLQIDSSKFRVIEGGLRAYNGKAIVNSVSGEEEKMQAFFPLIKKYGAAFIGLCLDENGIPQTAQGRLEIARKIMERALSYGIGKEDIIIDGLALSLSSSTDSAKVALETIGLIKKDLGLKTILGLSNISFGLPNRDSINLVFLLQALERGLDLGIINPLSPMLREFFPVYELLKGRDAQAQRFLSLVGEWESKDQGEGPKSALTVNEALSKGLEEDLLLIVEGLLREKSEMAIIDEDLIPALDLLGKEYEQGRIFLPQLIKGASTAKAAFNLLKESIQGRGGGNLFKGQIVLATVKGDIHDIGKNIAKVILENYGYKVYDLGKDVAISRIVDFVKEKDIALIGLSALMTSSLESMEETIGRIKSLDPNICVMVGGAVLNEKYAQEMGADYYVADARQNVEVAKKVFP